MHTAWVMMLGVVGMLSMGRLAPAASTPPAALTGATHEGFQEAVRSQMQDLVESTLREFFVRQGRELPLDVSVTTHAAFESHKNPPVIRLLTLGVSMTSNQPPAVLREVRAQIMQALRAQGYRFEANAKGGEAQQPQAKLTLEVRSPTDVPKTNGTREYLIFAALILGCLAFLVLACYLLLSPWRRRAGATARRTAAAVPVSPGHVKAALSRQDWPQGPLPEQGLPPLPTATTLDSVGLAELPPLKRVHGHADQRVDPKLV